MRRIVFAAALAAASFAVLAQGYSPPQGRGPGYGPGPGMRGAGCCGAEVTQGWGLMTQEERAQHQEKMHGMKDYAECQAYLEEHYKLMQDRARQRNQALPSGGRGPGCQWLKKPA